MQVDADEAAIREVTARYVALLDAGDWDRLVAVFTPEIDVELPGRPAARTTAAAFVADVARHLAGAVTEHRLGDGVVSLTAANAATAEWAMTDSIRWPAGSPVRSLRGDGHYHDDYLRTTDGWRISALRLRRGTVETDRATADVVDADPEADDAVAAVDTYVAELRRRDICGHVAGADLAAERAGFAARGGAFVVARADGVVVGCGGLRDLGDGTGEIKRMWVDRRWRGNGLGRRQLVALEERARAAGHRRVVLDTHVTLDAAIALYRSSGYVEIEPYNDNDDAGLWFAKPL